MWIGKVQGGIRFGKKSKRNEYFPAGSPAWSAEPGEHTGWQ